MIIRDVKSEYEKRCEEEELLRQQEKQYGNLTKEEIKDIELIRGQVVVCSEHEAIDAYIKNDGDIVNAIMDLQF